MFFTYLWRELRRRVRQASFIAVGLALGIGLVITVTAASGGVKSAQASVLHSLYGVGTDITVTKAAAAGSGGGFNFGFQQQAGSGNIPAAGTKVNLNSLGSGGTLATISSAAVTSVSRIANVSAAAGGLSLTDRTVNGTVPSLSSGSFGGGAGGGGGLASSFNLNSFSVQGVDIGTGELGPLSTGTISSGRTLAASDASSDVALVDSSYATQKKLKAGDTIAIGSSANKATTFKVVGIVTEPAGDNPADAYIPLGVAQSLAGMKNQVNTIYVAASSGQDITTVASAISTAVPGTTVTDENSLASQVSGSISSAASLADNLGKWLAVAVLVAAFALASLLTMSAVARRVREFGTLKALGWKSSRIVSQVVGESLVTGIAGGAVGVALGFGGAALVKALAPPLTATVGQATGSATPGGARQFGGGGGGGFHGSFHNAASTASTVSVHLSAPVTISAVAVAVALAVLGGLIAGAFGGWRASLLRPAAALAKVA